jgi:replicative DNA helicase
MKPEMQPNTDAELERALLGALLADNRAFDQLGQLEPDDLSNPLHASALAAMLDLKADGRAVNLVTLRSRFAAVPFGNDGSVLDYLKACGADGKAWDIAAALRELSQRREIALLGERIAGSVHDHGVGPATLLTDAARQLDDLLARCRPAGKTLRTMSEAVDALLAAKDDAAMRVPTSFADFDRHTGGFRRGEFWLLGGRPSMGKSTIGVVFSRRPAKVGRGVMVFSLEMTAAQWMARMATDACWSRERVVSYNSALRGTLDPHDRAVYERAANSLRDLPILIDDASGLTVADIAARTRKAAEMFARQGRRLDLVIVDHLGKIQASSRYKGQKVHEITEISDAMAHLAKSEQVAVLALHQLNRGVEARDNKRAELADLRDSGSLEQDADGVLLAYRAAYYLERMKFDDAEDEADRIKKLNATRNEIEIAIAKQRNGPTATVELYCEWPPTPSETNGGDREHGGGFRGGSPTLRRAGLEGFPSGARRQGAGHQGRTRLQGCQRRPRGDPRLGPAISARQCGHRLRRAERHHRARRGPTARR